MQGIGAVVGSLFLIVLIYFSDQSYTECDLPGSDSEGVNPVGLNTVWRSFLFIGLIFHTMVLLYRWLILEENEEGIKKLKQRKAKREKKLTLRAIFGFYGTRVVGTAGCWFLWDVAFYGLKLFSGKYSTKTHKPERNREKKIVETHYCTVLSNACMLCYIIVVGPIFEAINPEGGLLVNNGFLLLNNLLALIGYYGCSMIIDNPKVGRMKVQLVFFILVSIVFLILSFLFTSLPPGILITLYFLSSILGQFVNVTTYVMAAETYPSELRGTLHGLSAFTGKAGALIATIVFGYCSTETIFLICGISGMVRNYEKYIILYKMNSTCTTKGNFYPALTPKSQQPPKDKKLISFSFFFSFTFFCFKKIDRFYTDVTIFCRYDPREFC